MPDFQTLDNIADAYTPALLATCLLLLLQSCMQKNWPHVIKQVSLLACGLGLTYTTMLLDHTFNIWPSLNMDYSTHSAIALALSVFLIYNLPAMTLFWLSALIAYFLLMLYQQYHSLSDIVTTCLFISTCLLPISHKLYGQQGISQNPKH